MGNRANYTVVAQYADRLIIRDVGPWDKHMTVTNDAENVVKELAAQLNGRMLLYFDSEGELGRLHVRDGKFVGFAPAP
jgi:hypothetical protein